MDRAHDRYVTADEFERMPDTDGLELVDGRIVEKPVGMESNRAGFRLGKLLDNFCDTHPIGHVIGCETGFRCFGANSEKVRKPDAALIRLGRLPGEQLPRGDCPIAPDLAVESLSPNDTALEVDAKIAEYFSAGVRRVWVINPDLKTVRVFRPDGHIREFRSADVLSDEEIVPGFSCPVSEIFRKPAGA